MQKELGQTDTSLIFYGRLKFEVNRNFSLKLATRIGFGRLIWLDPLSLNPVIEDPVIGSVNEEPVG
jgi:hypothetical protein